MAKIIPVSVSPILTLDASQATTGTNSLLGLIGQRLNPDEVIEPPISSLSSKSASSTPISTKETGLGLNFEPWSDCIERVDSSTRDSGMEGSPMTSGMLFICCRGSVVSCARWSKVRFPQFQAGKPPLPSYASPVYH